MKIVGEYIQKFNDLLEIEIKEQKIYQSQGLGIHITKRKHYKCLKYIDKIPEIIDEPDYIGINPNEQGTATIELVKRYKDNVLVGIKLDKDKEYLYVSTMHDIQESKLQRRLHSGRLKEFSTELIDNKE